MHVGKSLADGQLASSAGTLYTVPASSSAIIKGFILFNTGTSKQTANVYITRSGSSRRQLYQFVLLAKSSASVITDGEVWVLSAGDLIEADTTTAATVDYTIMGADNA